MPLIPLSELPDDARLWVFTLSRTLTPGEEAEVQARADGFLEGWAAHGAPLTCGREWVEGVFLLVGVDESTSPPSGCSIDALTRILREEGARLGMSFLDHGPVWFRRNGPPEKVARSEFARLVGAGGVGLDTPVFDNTITRLSQFRDGEWEKPAGASWHRRAFFPTQGP